MTSTEPSLESLATEYRERAKLYPITKDVLVRILKDPSAQQHYMFRWGKFHATTWYETHCSPPRWHASITILDEISELEYGAQQEALLAVESWTEEDKSRADSILGECLGAEIVRDSQQVMVHDGAWSRHWWTVDTKGDTYGQSNIIHATH